MKNPVIHSRIYMESSQKFTIKLTTNKSFQMGISSVVLNVARLK